jgi:hypothetical protein
MKTTVILIFFVKKSIAENLPNPLRFCPYTGLEKAYSEVLIAFSSHAFNLKPIS